MQKPEFLDWAVTVYFYVAVHLIESYLAVHGYHSDNHTERNRHIGRIPQLRPIYNEYWALLRLSRQARYHAQPVTSSDLKIAQEKLTAIEGHIVYVTTGKKSYLP